MKTAEKTQLLELIERFVRNKISMLQASMDGLSVSVPDAVELLDGLEGRILVSGVGKSGHIAVKTASTMTSLGIPSQFMHAVEAFHGDLGMVGERDGAILFSHSGETKETLRLAKQLKRFGVKTVAVTGREESALATECDATVSYRMEKEGSPSDVAPMASAVAMLVIGDLVAAALSERRGFTGEEFARRHPGGALGLQLTPVSEVMTTGDEVPTVPTGTSFRGAVDRITSGGLGVVAVTDGERLAGVLTDGDVRRYLRSEAFSLEAPVDEVMTKEPLTIKPDATLQYVLRTMEDLKVMSLFITDTEDRPVGVVHMHRIIEEKIV